MTPSHVKHLPFPRLLQLMRGSLRMALGLGGPHWNGTTINGLATGFTKATLPTRKMHYSEKILKIIIDVDHWSPQYEQFNDPFRFLRKFDRKKHCLQQCSQICQLQNWSHCDLPMVGINASTLGVYRARWENDSPKVGPMSLSPKKGSFDSTLAHHNRLSKWFFNDCSRQSAEKYMILWKHLAHQSCHYMTNPNFMTIFY